MERPRAADDFDVIRERLEELRRERGDGSAAETTEKAPGDGADDAAAEQQRQKQCEGTPPAWVPTIFLPQPTD